MPSSTQQTFQSLIQPVKSAFNLLSYTFQTPVKIILLGFVVEHILVNAEQKCDATLPIFDFPTTDLLDQQYYGLDVYSNTKKLSDVELYFFGVNVLNVFEYETQNKLINYLGNSGNLIYFSGVAGQFPCQTFCLTTSISPSVTQDPNDCLPLVKLDERFTCQGWDNHILALRHNFNKYLHDQFHQRIDLFLKMRGYSQEYKFLKDALVKLDIQLHVLDNSVTVQHDIVSEQFIWFLNMGKLLDVIHLIYQDCIQDELDQARQVITEVRKLIPNSTLPQPTADAAFKIMLLMEGLLPKVEKSMFAIADSLNDFYDYYQKNYDTSLTNEIRVKQGLVDKIKKSKSTPGKKFFISPAIEYFAKGHSNQFFPNCNTSELNKDITASLGNTPYAVMTFRRLGRTR